MASKLYVGNLPFGFTAQDLRRLFEPFGAVRSADVVMDRMTGRSRGFGFVEMESEGSVPAAIQGVHDTEVAGRKLVVNEARERAPGGPRAAGPGRGVGFGGPRPGGGGFRGGDGGVGPRGGGGGFHGGGGFRSGGGGGRGGGRGSAERGAHGDKGPGREGRERWEGDDD